MSDHDFRIAKQLTAEANAVQAELAQLKAELKGVKALYELSAENAKAEILELCALRDELRAENEQLKTDMKNMNEAYEIAAQRMNEELNR